MDFIRDPVTVAIAGTVLIGLLLWAAVYYSAYAVRSQVFGRTFWRGDADREVVAITFDDGPSDRTDQLLDILDADGVKATFFLLGSKVDQFGANARSIVRRGHEVGNHSYSHPLLLFTSASGTRTELIRTQEAILRETGTTAKLARPPYGVRTPAYFRSARDLGLITIQWSDAGFDWKPYTAEQIAENVLRKVRSGSIILLHDYGTDQPRRQQCVKALPLILKGLREKGLKVVPLSDLIPELSKGEASAAAALRTT